MIGIFLVVAVAVALTLLWLGAAYLVIVQPSGFSSLMAMEPRALVELIGVVVGPLAVIWIAAGLFGLMLALRLQGSAIRKLLWQAKRSADQGEVTACALLGWQRHLGREPFHRSANLAFDEINSLLASLAVRTGLRGEHELAPLWARLRNGDRGVMCRIFRDAAEAEAGFAASLGRAAAADGRLRDDLLLFLDRYERLHRLATKHDDERVVIDMIEEGEIADVRQLLDRAAHEAEQVAAAAHSPGQARMEASEHRTVAFAEDRSPSRALADGSDRTGPAGAETAGRGARSGDDASADGMTAAAAAEGTDERRSRPAAAARRADDRGDDADAADAGDTGAGDTDAGDADAGDAGGGAGVGADARVDTGDDRDERDETDGAEDSAPFVISDRRPLVDEFADLDGGVPDLALAERALIGAGVSTGESREGLDDNGTRPPADTDSDSGDGAGEPDAERRNAGSSEPADREPADFGKDDPETGGTSGNAAPAAESQPGHRKRRNLFAAIASRPQAATGTETAAPAGGADGAATSSASGAPVPESVEQLDSLFRRMREAREARERQAGRETRTAAGRPDAARPEPSRAEPSARPEPSRPEPSTRPEPSARAGRARKPDEESGVGRPFSPLTPDFPKQGGWPSDSGDGGT